MHLTFPVKTRIVSILPLKGAFSLRGMDKLKKEYERVRLMLLASLVFFLIGLFALVSRWDTAFFIILFACLFRLLGVWLVRRRYNAVWMEESACAAAEKRMKDVRYTDKEEIPTDLLPDLGFTPPVSLVPQNKRYHVLRGTLAGKAATAAETAFMRLKESGRATTGTPVSGTMITVEDALPKEENWVILWRRPFDGVMPLSDFYSIWTYVETPKEMDPDGTACFTPGGETAYLEKAAAILAPFCKEGGIALAARDGKLSLLLSGVFYAKKPVISQAPSEAALKSGVIPGLDLMQKLCASLR